MPRTIKADGRTITVPDDATPDEINQIVGPGPSASSPPSTDQPSWWDRTTAPLTTLTPHGHHEGTVLGSLMRDPAGTAKTLGQEGVTTMSNIGAGGLGVVLHPYNTVKSIGRMALEANPASMLYHAATRTPTMGQEMGQQFAQQPVETAEAAVGQAGAAPIFGAEVKAPFKLAAAVPKIAREGASILAGTTPKVAAELGKDTLEANTAAQTKADTANTAIQSKRAQDLQKHFEKTQQVRAQNEATQAAQSRKVALQRGVEQLDPKFQEDLQTTEKNVRSQANAKYDTVRAAVAGETVPSESLAQAVKTAEGKIQGSSENLKVFRDILAKHPEGSPDTIEYQGAQIPKGHPLYDIIKDGNASNVAPADFSTLQGYYSELGEKLSAGNLPGDVYQAMKSLQGSIGDLMQGMAESKGVGSQLTDARSFYRDYMNAFRDSKSPLNKAMNAAEPGHPTKGAIAKLQGMDQSGVETLARYNPELARRANTIRNYQAESKAIPAKTVTPKPEPTLPPKPAPVLADLKKVGLGDIQQAKTNKLLNSKGPIGGKFGHLAGGAGSWHVISSAMYGNPEGVALGGAVAATPYVLGRIFRSPAVVRLLSQPTPADIAAIPPEVRGELPQIVDAAQKQGIKVHPSILLMARPNAQQ